MDRTNGWGSYLSLLTLREIRRYVVRTRAVAMSAFIAVVYALTSMLEGGMLLLQHVDVGGPTTVTLILASGIGFQSWNYPGLLIVAPWGIVSLPFFGTISMALVAMGVGLGMSSAVMLGVALARGRSARAAAGPTTLGSLAGLTPAMVGLLALGACCSTTAAATAGVGVIAQLGGTSTTNLLVNSWYLGVFQITVVWVALIAQEMLLRVYGGWFDPEVLQGGVPIPRWDRRALFGGALRAALLIAGVLWSLAVFVDWTTVSPLTAAAGQWLDWLLLHFLVSTVALVAALFPTELSRRLDPGRSTGGSTVLRWFAGAAGLLLAVGVPPPLSRWGMEGALNEMLGGAGLPGTWGAVVPPFAPGLALAFRWGVEFLFLGVFAFLVALRPGPTLRPLLWSIAPLPRAQLRPDGVVGGGAPSA